MTLFEYGYENVYELGPLLDVTTAKIRFAGTMRGELVRPDEETA